jgi:hypothetical protein
MYNNLSNLEEKFCLYDKTINVISISDINFVCPESLQKFPTSFLRILKLIQF